MRLMICVFAMIAQPGFLLAADGFPKYTLETENHVVEITARCPEGDVSCDRVTYRGVSKETGAALVLRRGSTVHTTCADGVTPCRFVGYRFQNGRDAYFVAEDLDGLQGTLSIKRNGKVLLMERGTWK